MDPTVSYFDGIIYSKGSCVLRMIVDYIGKEAFFAGLRNYLKAHAFGNAVTDDLLRAWDDVSDKNIMGVVKPWITTAGYPTISVTEDGTAIGVEQHRFLSTGDLEPEEDTIYPVVVNLRTRNAINDTLLLTNRSATYKVPDSPDDFYLINANYTGFWRVNYPPSRIAKLASQAASGLLTTTERMGLIADAQALASSGTQPTRGLLRLAAGLGASEESPLVWQAIISAVRSTRSAFLSDAGVTAAIDALVRNITAPVVARVGWDVSPRTDPAPLQNLKVLLFLNAGQAGNEAIVAAARKMFAQVVAGNESAVSPSLLEDALSIALKFGGVAEVSNYCD